MPRISLAPAIALTLVACGAPQETRLVAQVQAGPGSQTRATRVLSLSASCGSVDFECPPEYIETVDGIVRSTMEFAGYSLVEPRTLRVETRERTETREREVVESDRSSRTTENRPLDFDRDVTSESRSRTTRTTSTTVLTGPGFDDLTVGERKQVLAEAGADSVLNVRVVVGARVGEWSPNQNVEVMVRLGVEGGDVMAWASRCSASSNTYSTVNAALENAARCAVYGGTGR